MTLAGDRTDKFRAACVPAQRADLPPSIPWKGKVNLQFRPVWIRRFRALLKTWSLVIFRTRRALHIRGRLSVRRASPHQTSSGQIFIRAASSTQPGFSPGAYKGFYRLRKEAPAATIPQMRDDAEEASPYGRQGFHAIAPDCKGHRGYRSQRDHERTVKDDPGLYPSF